MKEYKKLKSLKFLYEISQDGILRNIKSKKIINGFISKDGYHRITLSNKALIKDGVRGNVKTYLKHRLIAEAWLPIPQKYLDEGYTIETLTVNHKNHNKSDNSLNNIEWLTFDENIRYTFNNSVHTKMRDGLMKASNSTKKKVIGKNIETNEEIEFESIRDAMEYVKNLGLTTSGKCIEKVLYKHRKVAYKHTWKYL